MQSRVRVMITLPVLGDLGLPVAMVGPCHSAVDRTSVPEAAINEHGELDPAKDDVGPAPEARKDGNVGPISHPTAMKFLPKPDFRMRVSAPVRPHPGLGCS